MLSTVAAEAPEMGNANPFDELRPVLRSEEDDIRKGIFSTALKRLRTIAPEEKIDWCVAIQEATAPKIPTSSSATTAGTKRARETPEESQATSAEAMPTAVTDAGDVKAPEKTPEESQSELIAAVRAFTPAQASEYVAAFMRAQLDKVVGGSLNNLAVASLRVLCLMLGIVTRARGKDALYNTLASYYYTHCEKLGKRVSRDTVSKSLAEQDAAMLNRLLPSTKPHKATPAPAPASAASSSRPPKATAKVNDENTLVRTAAATVKGNAAPLPASHRVKATSSTATAAATKPRTATEKTAGVEIDYGARVFSRPTSRAVASPASSSRNDDDEQSEPALCGVALERKVASIIQLYDPVTVDIIVKKLAQIGFRHDNAARIVEDILRTFHQKQLIFFDSGIAYMM